MFDGSAYSLSGNGAYVPHDNFTYIIPRTNLSITIPAGTGGGCIQTGPFVNMSVNLGPVNSAGSLPGYIGSGNGLDYNPRCLTRDFNTAWSRDGLNYERVTDTILQSVNYATLNSNLGRDGVHPSGHFTIGGMQDDLFESPADPAFYLHHAQLDRIWAIWQSLDPAERQNQLQGSTIWWNCEWTVCFDSYYP